MLVGNFPAAQLTTSPLSFTVHSTAAYRVAFKFTNVNVRERDVAHNRKTSNALCALVLRGLKTRKDNYQLSLIEPRDNRYTTSHLAAKKTYAKTTIFK